MGVLASSLPQGLQQALQFTEHALAIAALKSEIKLIVRAPFEAHHDVESAPVLDHCATAAALVLGPVLPLVVVDGHLPNALNLRVM